MTVDKRDVGDVFRERLSELAGRYGGNQAAFARAIRDDSVPVVSGEDGFEALRIAEQINAQLKDNLN